MTLGPDTQLGHYRILRSLGSGGMADVFEAQDTMLDRVVALKVLPIEYSRNPQLVARFQKEVRAAAKLNHRNIVTVFEVGQEGPYHFFSMRLLTGGDLRKRIQRGLSPLESLAILRELADAFAHAHARGFVHRDVKPENVMFDEQGFPVLTDFGIAKALDANTHMTRTGMTMGTPRYLSPEQASGKPVDARADLYSLGVMFYEMLTGRPPYDAEESMAVIFKHVTEPVPILPPEVVRYQPLLEKLMAKNVDQRMNSASELVAAIDTLAPGAGDATPADTGDAPGSGGVKQSQVRTAVNPLLGGLLTPSPLRTPPMRTPAPRTPAPRTPVPTAPRISSLPPEEDTGEVLIHPQKIVSPTRKPAAAPQEEAAVGVAAAPAGAAQSRAGILAIAGGLAAVALAGTAFLVFRPAPTAPAAVEAAGPTAVPRTEPVPEPAQQAQAERTRQEQKEVAAQARRQADEQARTEALARKRADEEAARKEAADRSARQQAETEARKRAEAREAQLRAQQEEAQRRAVQEAAAQDAAKRKAAEAEARRQAREATVAAAPRPAPARLTVVNDCRQVIEMVLVDPDGRPQPAGTLPPDSEKALDSYLSAQWRIFEKSRRRPLLKELTLTDADQRLLVCNTAEAERSAEEVAKERARRPTGF